MIYLLAFLMNVTTGLMIISNPLLAIGRFNAGAVVLGALGTAAAGTYALSCAGSGFIIEKLGSRKMMILSCILLALVFPSVLLISQLWHLFALAMCVSLGLSFFWPSLMSWLGKEERGEQLRKSMGNFNMALIAGIMLGNFICGQIFSWRDIYPYLLSTGLVLVVLFLLVGQRKTRGPVPSAPVRTEEEEKTRPVPGFIFIGWLANFASWFAIGASEALFPKLAQSLRIQTSVLAILIAMIPLGQLIIFSFLRKTRRWHYNFPLLIFFQLAGMSGLTLFSFTVSRPLFALGFMLIGFSGGMTYFSSLFYSLYRQKAKGKTTGFHESFLGMGVALGPIAGGLVARLWNLRAPYPLCIIVFILSIVIQVVILERSKTDLTRFIHKSG